MPIIRRRIGRKRPALRRRRVRRPGLRIRRVPRGPTSLHRFKRLTREVRIAHYNGAAANQFVHEDPANILNFPVTVPAALWFAESMPNTYQNQFACVHRLNQLEVPSDFTALFDRYKITGVKATFMFQQSDANMTGLAVLPTILYCTDYDDDVPPTYSQMRQKQNIKQKVLQAGKPFSIFYRPKLSGTVTADYANVAGGIVGAKGWVDTAIANADYYGLKFAINNMYSSTTNNSQIELKFTYYLAMKDPQ